MMSLHDNRPLPWIHHRQPRSRMALMHEVSVEPDRRASVDDHTFAPVQPRRQLKLRQISVIGNPVAADENIKELKVFGSWNQG